MFTGLIETVGRVEMIKQSGSGAELVVDAGGLSLSLGDSLAVNGVCLTAESITGSRVRMSVMPETMRLTNLGKLGSGDDVNLERALSLGKPLGGHLVSGHVDAAGKITGFKAADNALLVTVEAPAGLMPLIAVKGSVAVDGISLTVVSVDDNRFTVSLVGHTRRATTMRSPGIGRIVNVEADMLARYVKRLLESGSCPQPQPYEVAAEGKESALEAWLNN
ncbi:MAG: riboflavin synthase [bacterium]|nr:riboflavin synthase [bacterium]